MNCQEYLSGFNETIHSRTVGREAEIPLIWTEGYTSGDAALLWDLFSDDPEWPKLYDDTHIDVCLGVKNRSNGWTITTDAGPGIVEAISPPCQNLFEMNDGFGAVMRILRDKAATVGMCLLGYGAQPITRGAKNLWVKKGRYAALMAALGDEFVNDATVVASDQCHVSIARNELVQAVNVMNALAGPMIALTANSSISYGSPNGYLAWREQFWDRFNGFDGQVGIPKYWFADIDSWLDYLLSQRFIMRKASPGVYEPRGETFREFMKRSVVSDSDFLCHEGCCWWDARPRRPYSTIEVRPACQQPPNENMVVQALTLGLVNNLNAAEAIVNRWGYETLKRYRFEAIRRGLAAELGDRLAIPLLEDVLSAADEGLRSRGLNEEVFLQPLFRRLANKRLPANTAIHIWLRGGARKFVNYFKY